MTDFKNRDFRGKFKESDPILEFQIPREEIQGHRGSKGLIAIFGVMMTIDSTFMQRCLDLAYNGLGATAPNPMVGAVIVHDGKIIGEGFHTGLGKHHAEVEAVNQVLDQSILPASTLYVNLEPCNHHGKTPPCTDLIFEKGIRKVVIGQYDSNQVAGGGVERLRKNGIEVITGVLEQECRFLNRRFNTFHEKKRPYLILKWAQTTDGFVDNLRIQEDQQKPSWITDEACRRLVHKWRSEEQAIMAGSATILHDNPQLNVRAWVGKNPVRIVIDRAARITGNKEQLSTGQKGDSFSPLKIVDGTAETIIYTCQENANHQNVKFIQISPIEPVWPQVLADLYNRNIQSVLIEGGPTLLSTLIEAGLFDEARVFIGPGWFGSGVKAPDFPFSPIEEEKIGNSRLLIFKAGELRSLIV